MNLYFLKWLVLPFIVICCLLIINHSLSLSVKIIQFIFSLTPEVTDKKRLMEVTSRLTVKKDLPYVSNYSDSLADIFYPNGHDGSYPVVFWIHGGAYVASSKESVAEYASNLADSAQVAVISMDYQLAPGAPYPSQLIQTSQMVAFFISKKADYPMLDFNRLFIGGDSAGGQIAAQYLLTQTNQAYGKELGIPLELSPSQIKGAILLCGPYEINQLKETHGKSFLAKFLYQTVAWALVGKKKWQNEPEVEEASIAEHLTANFPPSFITDGNKLSFPEQAKTLDKQLNRLGIEHETLFFEDSPDLGHEYQFDFTKKEALIAFEQVIHFIHKQLKK